MVSLLPLFDICVGQFLTCLYSVPLCYVYPALLHLKAVAQTRRQKVADYLMIVFGMIAAVYTTVQTVKVIRLAPLFNGGSLMFFIYLS